jgi:hypothetical protein
MHPGGALKNHPAGALIAGSLGRSADVRRASASRVWTFG